MPNGGHTPDVAKGLRCAACNGEFVEAHGRPVMCPPCWEKAKVKGTILGYTKAWHELTTPS